MIGWKVVDQDYRSVVINQVSDASEYILKYAVNKITTASPVTFGIFFFKHKRDAMKFAQSSDHILKISIPKTAYPRVREQIHYCYNLTSCYLYRDKPEHTAIIGTWTADFVKVISEVHNGVQHGSL